MGTCDLANQQEFTTRHRSSHTRNPPSCPDPDQAGSGLRPGTARDGAAIGRRYAVSSMFVHDDASSILQGAKRKVVTLQAPRFTVNDNYVGSAMVTHAYPLMAVQNAPPAPWRGRGYGNQVYKRSVAVIEYVFRHLLLVVCLIYTRLNLNPVRCPRCWRRRARHRRVRARRGT